MVKLILNLIKTYQSFLSPINFGYHTCRFEPSCSNYTYLAVKRHGAAKGTALGVARILRCNPFSKGGPDPVPNA